MGHLLKNLNISYVQYLDFAKLDFFKRDFFTLIPRKLAIAS